MSENLTIDSLIRTALWTGYASNEDGTVTEPLDTLFEVDDVPAEIVAELAGDLTAFVLTNLADIDEYLRVTGCDRGQMAHDFHLTRNGHGAGFWDRGAGDVGERLTEAAKTFGTAEITADLDDDGNVVGGMYITN